MKNKRTTNYVIQEILTHVEKLILHESEFFR